VNTVMRDTAARAAVSAVSGAAIVGSRSGPTPNHPATATWYARLRKPYFTPPGPVFGVARGMLDLMLAFAGYRLMREPARPARTMIPGTWAATVLGPKRIQHDARFVRPPQLRQGERPLQPPMRAPQGIGRGGLVQQRQRIARPLPEHHVGGHAGADHRRCRIAGQDALQQFIGLCRSASQPEEVGKGGGGTLMRAVEGQGAPRCPFRAGHVGGPIGRGTQASTKPGASRTASCKEIVASSAWSAAISACPSM
jgi:hypothetical protein